MSVFIAVVLASAYAILMLRYRNGWRALPEWQIPPGWQPATQISVVIPARNEAACIEACLESVAKGSYPSNLLEIIVVDDFSDDDTAARVQYFSEHNSRGIRVVLLQLSGMLPIADRTGANKKKAIALGVSRAGGHLIVTTDADCIAPPDWLRLIGSKFDCEKNVALLAGPVVFHRERNLLQRFQSLDMMGMTGITGSGIYRGWQRMANGANLAFVRSVFYEAGGYTGNEDIASGDDMFLVQKVAAIRSGGVFFLKNPAAAILTEAKPDWASFFQQRLRWGTKNAALPEWSVKLSLLAVFLFCWNILLCGLAALLWRSPACLWLFSGQLLVKAVFDCLLLAGMCRYFGRQELLRWFLPSFLLHTLYIPVLGTASLFVRKYTWKGRKVS
jgi:cellulose synthase/poly-beta-1,6-N-acetylglucosamine synthase-like glycosyltransferase